MNHQFLRRVAAFLICCLLLPTIVGCIRLVELPQDPSVAGSTFESEAEIFPEEESRNSESAAPVPPDTEATGETDSSGADSQPSGTESATVEETTEGGSESSVPSVTEEASTVPEPKKIKIYVDQGHNPSGTNTGAQGNGLKEEDVTWAVGMALAALLRENPDFEVRLSRPSKTTVLGTTTTESLKARCDEANAWGADYFISIHANAFSDPSAHGVEAFSFSNTGEAFLLGDEIVDALVLATGFVKRGMKVRTDLYVLRHTVMPAVLVEIGFITNPTEAALMGSNPSLFAQAIYDGLLAHLKNAAR